MYGSRLHPSSIGTDGAVVVVIAWVGISNTGGRVVVVVVPTAGKFSGIVFLSAFL